MKEAENGAKRILTKPVNNKDENVRREGSEEKAASERIKCKSKR